MRAGLHRILGSPASVAAELTEQGWRVGIAEATSSTADFYAAVAHALDFPDWFGANLDALWDCLTDLHQPTALLLPQWHTFARARPDRWSRIEAVLRDRTKQDPPFAVLLL